ncbi:helix-turn-helix domain-containing protein [Streptomyces sp. NPDC006692]|uniref:helix-turn-helix domain-containing protein n=1 Tax=Streptomyces sp. NPDC006692 TaxID=3364758 RepID=UPI0036864316
MDQQAQEIREIVAGMLGSEKLRAVCAERDVGALFRLLNHRGISTRRLAAAVDISQGRLYDYMNGKSRVEKLAIFEQIADAFHIPGHLLGLASRDWEPPAVSSRQSTTPPVQERESLAVDAAASAKFARFVAARNADATTVDQLESDVARLARQFVSHPVAEVFTEIRDLREETFGLLRGRQFPRQTADLYMIAGRLCGLSAHVCLDAGDYSSATTHSRTVWVCAEAAGDNELRAWVRSVESLIAFWKGRPVQAAQLAQAGQQFRSPGTIGVRLASLEARALAVAGNAAAAADALKTANRAREAARDDDEDPGIFNFPVAKQFAYAGTTHLAIGGHRNVLKAIECAETAVTLYRRAADDDQSTGDLLAAHLDIARGHMLTGDLDATESLLSFVLDGESGQLSASILTRLDALGRELGASQYRGSSQVTQLRERIKSTAVPASLPDTEPSEPLT